MTSVKPHHHAGWSHKPDADDHDFPASAVTAGITRFSPALAMFRDALERSVRIGSIDSLRRVKATFAIRRAPQFFPLSRTGDIPCIALAALEAEAFIVRPRAAHTTA